MLSRPRRNRRTEKTRALIRETEVRADQLVLPVFVHEHADDHPIDSMPGHSRLSIEKMAKLAHQAAELGIAGLALFPAIGDELKNQRGSEGENDNGLLQRTVRRLKKEAPELVLFGDVALDPYSSDGHDGVVIDGEIENDTTVPILAKMALAQARAGIDFVAPSDMMDGRVEAIREALDEAGYEKVGIMSYCVKYASAFYGPFRNALDSAPRSGDKRTYQMDPANVREALREIDLDEQEGADILMVKPGLPYADVVRFVRENSTLPIASYHVSGEYAMLKAAAEKGWLDFDACLLESLLCLRRAGADMIFTYGALEAAALLR